jgi:hypothetical protein
MLRRHPEADTWAARLFSELDDAAEALASARPAPPPSA